MAVRPDKNIYQRLGIGNPGAPINLKEKEGNVDYSIPNPGTQDLKNMFPITDSFAFTPNADIPADLIKFQIEVINSTNPSQEDIIVTNIMVEPKNFIHTMNLIEIYLLVSK